MTLPTACPKPTPNPPRPAKAISKRSKRKLADPTANPFSTIPKSGKPLPKKNAKRDVKRKEQYRKKLAAYRKSDCYKQVEARAGGRCEQYVRSTIERAGFVRCSVERGSVWSFGEKLHHHHLTYSRFGGKELPEDIRVLCAHHHAEAEAQSRPWNRSRVSGGAYQEGK